MYLFPRPGFIFALDITIRPPVLGGLGLGSPITFADVVERNGVLTLLRSRVGVVTLVLNESGVYADAASGDGVCSGVVSRDGAIITVCTRDGVNNYLLADGVRTLYVDDIGVVWTVNEETGVVTPARQVNGILSL